MVKLINDQGKAGEEKNSKDASHPPSSVGIPRQPLSSKRLSDEEQAFLIWTTFTSEEEKVKTFLRYFLAHTHKEIYKDGVRAIDSNYYHFVLSAVLEKLPEIKKRIPGGWFYHGMYYPWLDDVLVDDFGN